MDARHEKVLTQFCKEAKAKKFSSYADEAYGLAMYMQACKALKNTLVGDINHLVNRISAYRKSHGRYISTRAC